MFVCFKMIASNAFGPQINRGRTFFPGTPAYSFSSFPICDSASRLFLSSRSFFPLHDSFSFFAATRIFLEKPFLPFGVYFPPQFWFFPGKQNGDLFARFVCLFLIDGSQFPSLMTPSLHPFSQFLSCTPFSQRTRKIPFSWPLSFPSLSPFKAFLSLWERPPPLSFFRLAFILVLGIDEDFFLRDFPLIAGLILSFFVQAYSLLKAAQAAASVRNWLQASFPFYTLLLREG